MSDLFEGLPLLKKAFSTPHPDYRQLGLKPDYVIIDRNATPEQLDEIATAQERRLIKRKLVEIDEQETQLRYYLTNRGDDALEAKHGSS